MRRRRRLPEPAGNYSIAMMHPHFTRLLLLAIAVGAVAPVAKAQAPAVTVPPADPVAPPGGAAAAAAEPAVAPAEKALQTQVEVQEGKVTEAEDRVALAKSGRLLRYGVTAGAALTIQTPFRELDGVKVETATLTVTPYLGVLPAYWTTSEERATYCSTTGLFQDGEQARRAATAISRKTAKIELESMLSWLNAAGFPDVRSITAPQIAARLNALGEKEAPYLLEEVPYLVMAARILAMADVPAKELQRQDVVNVLAAREWRPELAAPCGLYRLGLWVGRPFGYSADVTINKQRSTRDVAPVVSFGLLYTPNSYLTAMGGATYSTVVDAGDDANTTVHRPVWTLTFGLGGTLDIASLLTKN